MGKFRRKALGATLVLFVGLDTLAAVAEGSFSLAIEVGPRFGEFRVVNIGDVVRLRSAVLVERQLGEQWQGVPVSNLELRETCLGAPSPPCVEIGAKKTLRPVPWTGNFCSSQCPNPCRLDGSAPPGRYRFLVVSCQGDQTYASSPFEKPR